MELKTQVKALNYTKKLLTGDTQSILPWQMYPQKPVFRQTARTLSPLPTAMPEEVGIESQHLEQLIGKLTEIPAAQAHCLLVARLGKLIVQGGFAPYSAQLWHVSHSLCKSIVGMAIGILVDRNQLSVETLLSEIFPEYFNLFTPKRTRSLKIQHLLCMSSGVNFREMGALLEKDWLRSFFESDILFEPGTKFDYNSMNSYVLGCVVSKITGRSLSDFLTEQIFDPLGFGAFEWEICPMGREKGGWGMYLLPEDMAKLGILLLNKGVWKQNETESKILSESWVQQMTSYKIQGPQGNYGWHIWTLDSGSFVMNGMFGQYVYCSPKNDIVVVLCSGSSNIFSESVVLDWLEQSFHQASFAETLPIQEKQYKDLQECMDRLAFGKKSEKPAIVAPLPWYKQLLHRLYKPEEPIKENPYLKKILSHIQDKTFSLEKNHVGILPLMVQCMQGNYTLGVEQISFVQQQTFCMNWKEGNQEIAIPLDFEQSQQFSMNIGGEQWKMASIVQAVANEDDIPVLKILLCFLEHSAVRRIKLFFYPNKILLRLEETPSLLEALFQMRGTPQADLILDLFKDAGYARYKFEQFSAPELELKESVVQPV